MTVIVHFSGEPGLMVRVSPLIFSIFVLDVNPLGTNGTVFTARRYVILCLSICLCVCTS